MKTSFSFFLSVVLTFASFHIFEFSLNYSHRWLKLQHIWRLSVINGVKTGVDLTLQSHCLLALILNTFLLVTTVKQFEETTTITWFGQQMLPWRV